MTADAQTPSVPVRRLFIAIVMVIVSTLPVFLTGATFLQLSKDIGLSPTSLGAVTAAFFLSASIASTPLGRLVERIGWRKAMRINCVVSATVVILIALLVDNPITLGGLLLLSGVVYGFTNPAANYALAHGSRSERRGLVFGLKHAGIPASTLAAGAAVPLLVLTLGWRPTYAISSVFALVAWFLIRSEPELATGEDPRHGEPTSPSPRRLTHGQLVTLAIGSACGTWAAVFLGTFLVAAAVEVSFSQAQAGLLLFAGSAASIAARVVYGLLADRNHASGFLGVSVIMAAGSVSVALIAGAEGGVFIAAVLAGFALGWGWPGLMTYAVVNANTSTAASSSAVTQAGIFLGAGLGPVVLGAIVDNWSFQAAWLTVSALLAAAALVVGSVAFKRRPVEALAAQR